MRYLDYLQSDMWRARAAVVMKRDGYKCQRCGAPATEVHHKTYARIFEERWSDLVSLCSGCHQLHHGKLNWEDYCRQRLRQEAYEDHELSKHYR